MHLTFIEVIYLITACILFLTFLAVIYYACETQKLRKATVKQTELSLRPFVTITQSESATYSPGFGKGTHHFLYKNIGHSPALDVKTKPFKTEAFILESAKWGLIEVGETKDLNLKGETNPDAKDKAVRSISIKSFPTHFTPKELNERDSDFEIFLDISYKNIEKKSYSTKVKISREGIEVLSTGEEKNSPQEINSQRLFLLA